MAVSLTMIVRDEAANLATCLESVTGLFDEMVLVDTGSTDSTREIARSFGAKVFDFEWCDDFSAARNESLRHTTGEWAFSLDADEWFDAVNRERLRTLLASLSEPCVYEIRSESPHHGGERVTSYRPRLFHRSLGLKWRWRVHENLWPLEPSTVRRANVSIVHSGNLDRTVVAKKSARNLALLKLELRDRPDEPAIYYYLGSEYLYQGDVEAALRCFEKCRDMIGTMRQPYSWLLLFGLGRCYVAQGRWERVAAIEASDERLRAELWRLFPAAARVSPFASMSVIA